MYVHVHIRASPSPLKAAGRTRLPTPFISSQSITDRTDHQTSITISGHALKTLHFSRMPPDIYTKFKSITTAAPQTFLTHVTIPHEIPLRAPVSDPELPSPQPEIRSSPPHTPRISTYRGTLPSRPGAVPRPWCTGQRMLGGVF